VKAHALGHTCARLPDLLLASCELNSEMNLASELTGSRPPVAMLATHQVVLSPVSPSAGAPQRTRSGSTPARNSAHHGAACRHRAVYCSLALLGCSRLFAFTGTSNRQKGLQHRASFKAAALSVRGAQILHWPRAPHRKPATLQASRSPAQGRWTSYCSGWRRRRAKPCTAHGVKGPSPPPQADNSRRGAKPQANNWFADTPFAHSCLRALSFCVFNSVCSCV
jgi:hypothetical protein